MILGVTREFFYYQILNSILNRTESTLLYTGFYKPKKHWWAPWLVSLVFAPLGMLEVMIDEWTRQGGNNYAWLIVLVGLLLIFYPVALALTVDTKIENSLFCAFFVTSINPFSYLAVYIAHLIEDLPQFQGVAFVQYLTLRYCIKIFFELLYIPIVRRFIKPRLDRMPRVLVKGFPAAVLISQLIPIITRIFAEHYFETEYLYLYLFTFGITIALAGVFFFFYLKEHSKNERLAAAAEYEEKKHNYLDVISDYSAKLSRMSHDITNHLRTVQVLSQRSGDPECIAYSEKLLEEYKDAAKSFCKEPLLNSMLLYYDSLSKKNGVNFICNVSTGGNIAIDGVSLVTVFSNILDNAEEAAEKCAEGKRRIEFSLTADEFALSAVCKNSYNGELQKKGRGFSTTKANKNLHGLGISIVCDTVKNLGGKVDFQYDSGEFSATVYIPNTPKA